MKIKCVSLLPNEQQTKKLGSHYHRGKQVFGLSLDKEYIVYSLEILAGQIWAGILSDTGYIYSAPLCLFEIIEPHLSHLWELRILENGDILLWPSNFFADYYHDDLAEGVEEVVNDFQNLRKALDQEAETFML